MGLFDNLLSAVTGAAGNPGIAQALQLITSKADAAGIDSAQLKALLSGATPTLRNALNDVRQQGGNDGLDALLNKLGGTQENPQAVTELLGANGADQLANQLGAKAGVQPASVQALLPAMIPALLGLLKNSGGSKSSFISFLDADKDGDVDLADLMALAGKFSKR